MEPKKIEINGTRYHTVVFEIKGEYLELRDEPQRYESYPNETMKKVTELRIDENVLTVKLDEWDRGKAEERAKDLMINYLREKGFIE